MKAHRVKLKKSSPDEVWEQFKDELLPKIDKAMYENVGHGKGILVYAQWASTEDGIKVRAAVKLELIKEWERKGRNMAFLKENNEYAFMNLLNQKHYGKSL